MMLQPTNTQEKDQPLSRPVSPANLTLLQENVRRLVTTAIYGPKSLESCGKLDLLGFWVRTSPASSRRKKEPSSDGYSMTWPRWGSVRHGELYELPILELHTKGRGQSLLGTPRAAPAMARPLSAAPSGDTKGIRLEQQVARLPTPRSCSAMAAKLNPSAKFPNLETVIARSQSELETGERGLLNPSFVELMMGFPENYTLPD